MPDNLPNPDASAVVTPPAGPMPPQTQSPDMGGVQADQTPQPMQQMSLPGQSLPMQQAPPPQSGWHKALQSLMGNSTQYQQTPNGPVPVQVPNKPGQLFRSILAGAIMGGAAGQEAHNQNPYGGFASGLMPGAKAGMQNQQAEQQKSQQQARQQWQDQLTANKEKREQEEEPLRVQMMKANLADVQATTVAKHADLDFRTQNSIDDHNKAAQAMIDGLTDPKIGGTAPIDGKLPGDLTANQLVEAYQKDPSIRQVGDGKTYTRFFIDLHDHSKISFNGLHWIDASGNPVNMTDQTSIKVIDVPTQNMFVKKPTKGSELNSIMQLPKGVNMFDPDTDYMVAPADEISIYGNGMKDAAELGKLKAETKQLYLDGVRIASETQRIKMEIDSGKKAEMKAAADQLGSTMRSYESQLKTVSDPAQQKVLSDQLEKTRKEYQGIREKIYPNSILSQVNPAAQVTSVRLANGSIGEVPPENLAAFMQQNPGSTVVSSGSNSGGTPPTSVGPDINKLREMSPTEREKTLSNPSISLAQEDNIRRQLNIDPPNLSKYNNNSAVQRAITRLKKKSPEDVERDISKLDLDPDEANAIRQGIKRAK